MELIFNELSVYPLSINNFSVESRITGMIASFKSLKKEYGFTHIRFPQNFDQLQGTHQHGLRQCIFKIQNRTIQTLAMGLFKQPYTDDLDAEEISKFYSHDFSLESNDITKEKPFGLLVSYIKNRPAISFNSDIFWRKNIINISYETKKNDEIINVYNVFSEQCSISSEIIDWAKSHLSQTLVTSSDIISFLKFKTYNIVITEMFLNQFLEWKKNDPKQYHHLLRLMADVEDHPFTGGLGQTENLTSKGKEASKRINITDRLSYTLENNTVTFLACKGHYKHHNK